MAHKLTDDQISLMWATWQQRQSVLFVSKVCSVSPTTVRKYKREQCWDRRLLEIQRRARELADESEADRRSRIAEAGKELADGGMAFLREKGLQTARAAVAAVVEGIKIQQSALGLTSAAPEKITLEVVEVGPESSSPSLEFSSREEVVARLAELDRIEQQTKPAKPKQQPRKREEKEPWD